MGQLGKPCSTDAVTRISQHRIFASSSFRPYKLIPFPCHFHATSYMQVNLKRARKASPQCPYERAYLCCEVSPSNIARCRVCGSVITKGTIRFAYPVAVSTQRLIYIYDVKSLLLLGLLQGEAFHHRPSDPLPLAFSHLLFTATCAGPKR